MLDLARLAQLCQNCICLFFSAVCEYHYLIKVGDLMEKIARSWSNFAKHPYLCLLSLKI